MQRKIIGWFVLSFAAVVLLTGCSPIVNDVPEVTDIYATVYPLYALTQRIAEGTINTAIHCLVQPQDECARSYSLSDWDLYMLGYSADMVIAAGNGLESYQETLRTMGETLLPVAEVLQGIPMEQIHSVEHDDDSHFSGEIPHVYMSLNNVNSIAENIAGALTVLDAGNEELYEANCVTVRSEVNNLLEKFEKQTEVCTDIRVGILHEALIYPAMDCGLDIAAAFERESGEMLYGSSMNDCLNALADQGVQVVLIEKQAPKALVDALSDAGYRVVQLDVLSTHQETDGFDGYIAALSANMQMIIDACGDISQ